MSSHHSQKFFNLHHSQVEAGKARRLQRHVQRVECFLTGRQEARFEYNCILVFGFIGFAYIAFMAAVYLGYMI